MPLFYQNQIYIIPGSSVALKDEATKTACRKTFLQNVFFFNFFYSNLMINVIFSIFLVYPLHLNISSYRSETKRVNLMIV